MIYWAPFLHFYQPPTQYYNILDKIARESYRPLLKVLNGFPESKITINICGVLTEMLSQHGYTDILSQLIGLGKRGQIEFVGSSKFHAILPLIPEEEIKRQIDLHKKTNTYFLKDSYNPRGFFLPEMCYSDKAADIISRMGYEWIIVSGIACQDEWPLDVIYKPSASNLKVFFRDDIISNKISFKNIDAEGFIAGLKELRGNKENIYVVTAMDAETFGHHIKNLEKLFLKRIYEIIRSMKSGRQIKCVTISELLRKFKIVKSRPPIRSSWSTMKEEILKGNFYPLWKDPDNKIHSMQWEHMNICFGVIRQAGKNKHNEKSMLFFKQARETLDRALHSCQFWWANKGKTWNENLINKGLILQEEAIFNAYKSISVSDCAESDKKAGYRYVLIARGIAGKIRDEVLS